MLFRKKEKIYIPGVNFYSQVIEIGLLIFFRAYDINIKTSATFQL